MEKSFKTFVQCLCVISILVGLLTCNKDDETTPATTDCNVEVAECLTDGSRQAYFMYSSDGVPTTNNCFLSVQMGFEADGTFTWSSDSGTDANCLNRIGFEDFTGNWTLANNKTEIHITPPWFTSQGQKETVLKIVSLNETELTAETPSQVGISTIVWRRL